MLNLRGKNPTLEVLLQGIRDGDVSCMNCSGVKAVVYYHHPILGHYWTACASCRQEQYDQLYSPIEINGKPFVLEVHIIKDRQ